MKKYFIHILLSLIGVINANAQNIDSLIKVTNTGTSEQQINANIKLSDYYFYSKPDTAEYYLNTALEISKKGGFKRKTGIITKNLGILYNEKGLTARAEKYFFEVIKIAKEINDSSLWIASLGNLGNSAIYAGKYSEALEYATQVIDLFEKKNDNIGLGRAYGQIGNMYVRTREYGKALQYYNTAQKHFLLENDSVSAAIITLNLATIHTNNEQYDIAMKKFKTALKVFRKHNQKLNEAECLGGLANIYIIKNQMKKAHANYIKSLKIYKEINAQKNISICYSELGFVAAQTHKIAQAISYYDSAYIVAYKLKNYVLLTYATQDLQDIYQKQNQYKKAYKYAVLNKTFSDSLINIESVKKFNELEVKFETKQKEQQIELLTKENEIRKERSRVKNLVIAILIISVIALTLFFMFLINRRKLLAKQKQILNEQKLNRLQMSPHFIYNTLISVQNFMLENDNKNSVLYMSKFAKLMRDILESTQKDFISIDDELEMLQLYVDFQKLRSDRNFDYITDIDEDIDTEVTLIPPMIIQPFIENSIKHAFNNTILNPAINLKINKNGDKIFIQVSDNGVGINSKQYQAEKEHKSLAINITQNRLKSMYVKKSATFNIQDISEIDKIRTGTVISMEIPEKLEF